MALEITAANQFVKSGISAGLTAASLSSVKVYLDVADEDATYPCVTYSLVADPVRLKPGAVIAYAEPLYLVCVHARTDVTSATSLESVLTAVDSGLTGKAATTYGSHIVRGAWRDTRGGVSDRDQDTRTGVVFHRRGAYYRLFVQAP
jgi:hypothetical protein